MLCSYNKSNRSFDPAAFGFGADEAHTRLLVWSCANCAMVFLPLPSVVLDLPRDSAHKSSKSDADDLGGAAGVTGLAGGAAAAGATLGGAAAAGTTLGGAAAGVAGLGAAAGTLGLMSKKSNMGSFWAGGTV